ncbi:MAG: hypothetical protein KIT84_32650 [Labilithrix sp.]|nr:hypothetical protein [Labilithrix sp.]MCW5815825.1 hypothetical protein [Labilithrix sp.]
MHDEIETLTPEDEGALAELLAARSSFDLQGAVGFMHAVVSSPAPIALDAWRRVVRPDDAAHDELDRLLCAAFRVVDVETSRRRPFTPPPADADACASFARGYLVGLELWPRSVPRDDRVRCAAWACALADRLDLLPASDRAQFRLTTEGRAALRREIGRFMLLTYDLFAAPALLAS